MPLPNPLESDPTLASRFLAHQLTDEEREGLEAELLVDPEIVAELEATARFKVGLQKLRETGELDVLLAPRPHTNRFLLLAAAVIIMAIAAFLLWPKQVPTAVLAASVEQLVDPSGRVLSTSRTYSVLRRRTLAARTEIELPSSREAIKLRILPSSDLEPPYLVSLAAIRAQGEMPEVGSIIVPVLDADGRVTVFADSSKLVEGSYVLVISEVGAGKSQEPFLIDIVRGSTVK